MKSDVDYSEFILWKDRLYMKKRPFVIIATVPIITLLTGVFIMLHNLNESENLKTSEPIIVDLTDVGSFNLPHYKRRIEDPTVNLMLEPDLVDEKNVGIINNAQIAVEKARYIWAKYYLGNDNENYPARVSYDVKEDVWHVTTYFPVFYDDDGLPIYALGSSPHIIFRSNGEIITVFHDGMGGGW